MLPIGGTRMSVSIRNLNIVINGMPIVHDVDVRTSPTVNVWV